MTTQLASSSGTYAVWSPTITQNGTLLVTQIPFASGGDLWIMGVTYNTGASQFSISTAPSLLLALPGNDFDVESRSGAVLIRRGRS